MNSTKKDRHAVRLEGYYQLEVKRSANKNRKVSARCRANKCNRSKVEAQDPRFKIGIRESR